MRVVAERDMYTFRAVRWTLFICTYRQCHLKWQSDGGGGGGFSDVYKGCKAYREMLNVRSTRAFQTAE